MSWTDEERSDVIKKYEEANPTAETSIDIVKEIADEMGKTTNGVRMILSKASVYITASKGTNTQADTSDKPKRISKADAIGTLKTAIEALGLEADEEITSKLTGKAAMYFAEVINKAAEE